MITEVGQTATSNMTTINPAAGSDNPQAHTLKSLMADASAANEKPAAPATPQSTETKPPAENTGVKSILMGEPPPASMATEYYAYRKSDQTMLIREAAVKSAEEGLLSAEKGLAAGTHRQLDVDQAHLHLVNMQIKYHQANIENNTAKLNFQRVSGGDSLASTSEGVRAFANADADFRQQTYRDHIIPLAGQAEALAKIILAQSQADIKDKDLLASIGPLNIIHAEKAITAAQMVRADAEDGIRETGAQRQQTHSQAVAQKLSGAEAAVAPAAEDEAGTMSVIEARNALAAADQNVATLKEVVAHAKAARDDANNFQRIFHSAEVTLPQPQSPAAAPGVETSDKLIDPVDSGEQRELAPLIRANRANIAYYQAQIQMFEALITQKNAQIDLQMATENQAGKTVLTPAQAEQAKVQFSDKIYQDAIRPLAKEGLKFADVILDQAQTRDDIKTSLSNYKLPYNSDLSQVSSEDVKALLLMHSSVGLTELSDARELLTDLQLQLLK